MDKSTHKCEVLKIEEILPHHNAEKLEIIPVWGYSCCVLKGQYKVGDLICYVPPESIVNTDREEFAFLKQDGKTKIKVKVKKLRGVISQGLILKAPEFAKEGDDLATHFEVEHWTVPEEITMRGDNVKNPPGQWQKYDIDSARKYNKVFQEGEQVFITEKVNGANARYCFRDGKQYCGSRSFWKEESESDLWWKCLTPEIRKFCEENPELSIYGEACGQVKGFRYFDKPTFVAFDIARFDWTMLDVQDFLDLCKKYDIPTVPVLHVNHPFNYEECCKLAEGKCIVGKDRTIVREGVVIKPMKERWDHKIRRVVLKIVGNDYLEKS
jgi:RNA ligase (TIGR02306 family)